MDIFSLKRTFTDFALGGVVIATTASPLMNGVSTYLPAAVEHIVEPLASISPILGAAAGIGIGFGLPLAASGFMGHAASWGSAVIRARKNDAANPAHVFS